jgi:hypothetical protein
MLGQVPHLHINHSPELCALESAAPQATTFTYQSLS